MKIFRLDVDRKRVKNNKTLGRSFSLVSLELFFYLGFTARQDYFTQFEPSQSLGGAKTGDPQEKPSNHPQAELDLSHM